jgi:NAD(P)H-hydrate epimerase
LDKELMSVGAFSLDQLMELAGLSVSQAGKRKGCCLLLC